jgi:hypothetical protein
LDRWNTFTFSTYNTSVAPDYFFRWRTDHYNDIYLNSQSSNTRSVYLSPFVTGNTTAPRRVLFAQIHLSSTAYVETQSFQNLPDLIGSLYAFYASMFVALGLIFLRWNKSKFFKKNPSWSRVGPDFTVVPEDGGLESLTVVDGSFSKAKIHYDPSERELATVQALNNVSFDPTAAVYSNPDDSIPTAPPQAPPSTKRPHSTPTDSVRNGNSKGKVEPLPQRTHSRKGNGATELVEDSLSSGLLRDSQGCD